MKPTEPVSFADEQRGNRPLPGGRRREIVLIRLEPDSVAEQLDNRSEAVLVVQHIQRGWLVHVKVDDDRGSTSILHFGGEDRCEDEGETLARRSQLGLRVSNAVNGTEIELGLLRIRGQPLDDLRLLVVLVSAVPVRD